MHVKEKFQYVSREEAESVVRNRGYEDYAEYLSMSGLFLEGKTILDIGGGEGNFAREVKEKFKDVKVYNFDPCPVLGKAIESVRGIAQELPFKDDTFDLIVSFLAVPLYFKDWGDTIPLLVEIFRVLKRGGEARLAPFPETATFFPYLKPAKDKIKRRFEGYEADISIRFNDVLIIKKN